MDSANEESTEDKGKMASLIDMISRMEVRLKKNGKKHKISIETVESRNDIPELKIIQDNILK
jgi:hypothetical protein